MDQPREPSIQEDLRSKLLVREESRVTARAVWEMIRHGVDVSCIG